MVNKILASSVDPKELSLTFKGLLVGSVPIVMLILHAAGTQISQEQLSEIVVTVADAVGAFGTFASALMVLAGLFRKLLAARNT